MRLLSTLQLEQLTGYRQKAAQVRWLQRNGIRHYVRADGFPSVPESAIDAPIESRKGPNLAAVRRAG